MEYAVTMLTSKPDCQSVIDNANKQKDDLLFHKTELLRDVADGEDITVKVETDLVTVNAELSALAAVLPTLPDGPAKDSVSDRYKTADYKKFQLEKRRKIYGSMGFLGRQYDIASVERDIEEIDTFITAVTARMDELPGTAKA